MDCLRCLEEEADLVELLYENSDTHTMYLCTHCVRYFESDEAVKEIKLAKQPMSA